MLEPEAHTIIEGLLPRLRTIAKKYASPTIEMDDILGNMIVSLYNRAASDPTFLQVKPGYTAEQRDNYLVQYAAWQGAKNKSLLAAKTYDKYVQALPETSPEDEDDMDWAEHIADNSTSVEEEVSNREIFETIDGALHSLSIENQTIVIMTLEGYSNKEIAKHLCVSPSAISQRRNQIRQQMVGYFPY